VAFLWLWPVARGGTDQGLASTPLIGGQTAVCLFHCERARLRPFLPNNFLGNPKSKGAMMMIDHDHLDATK